MTDAATAHTSTVPSASLSPNASASVSVPAPASHTEPDSSSSSTSTDVYYPIKWIVDEHNRSIPVCMQNRNGPCALLALMNASLLQLDIRITPGTTRVSEATIMSLLADFVSQTSNNSNDEDDAERQAARQYAVTDFLDLLPSLNSGLDVNVRFDSPVSFEFTRQLSVFDVFPRVRLVHGWLVDPQDTKLMVALAPLTYNQLVDELVRTEHLPPDEDNDGEAVPSAPPADAFGEIVSVSPVNADATFDQQQQQQHVGPSTVHENNMAEHYPESEQTANVQSVQDGTKGRDEAEPPQLEINETENLYRTETQELVEAAVAEEIVKESVDTLTIREIRPQVVEFLETNSTQLTIYGLIQLHQTIREGEVAILFRNSHFHVIRKKAGEIYTLVTDEGYLNELNTVWEKLSDVTGDSTFYNGSFYALRPDGSVQFPSNQTPLPNVQSAAARGAGAGGTGAEVAQPRNLDEARRIANRTQTQGQWTGAGRTCAGAGSSTGTTAGSSGMGSPMWRKKKSKKKGECTIQ